MATRSVIVLCDKQNEKAMACFYHHWDGYPQVMGDNLAKSFRDNFTGPKSVCDCLSGLDLEFMSKYSDCGQEYLYRLYVGQTSWSMKVCKVGGLGGLQYGNNIEFASGTFSDAGFDHDTQGNEYKTTRTFEMLDLDQVDKDLVYPE